MNHKSFSISRLALIGASLLVVGNKPNHALAQMIDTQQVFSFEECVHHFATMHPSDLIKAVCFGPQRPLDKCYGTNDPSKRYETDRRTACLGYVLSLLNNPHDDFDGLR